MSGEAAAPGVRRWAVGVLTSTVGFAVAVGLSIGYTAKVDREAEQRNVQRSREICGLIVLIDDRNQQLPPTPDPDTAAFRTELHRYRLALGC